MAETCNNPDSTEQTIQTQLKSAIKSGDINLVKTLLTNSTKAQNYSLDLRNLFREAIKSGNAEIVEILIANGGDIREEEGLLALAVELSDAKMVNVLLANGVDARSDQYLLTDAVEIGNADIVKILLENGVAIPEDNKLLKKAVKYAENEIVKILLANGIGAKKEDRILRRAFQRGNNDIIETLLSNAADGKEISDDPDYNSLHLAAKFGNHFICHLILRKGGVDVNEKTRDSSDMTALHLAAERNDPLIAELLCQYGADIELRQFLQNATPLLIAAERGYTRVAEVLLRYGANIVNSDSPKQPQTPLHYAINEGSPERLQKFLEYRFTAMNDSFITIFQKSFDFNPDGFGSRNERRCQKDKILQQFLTKLRLARPKCISHQARVVIKHMEEVYKPRIEFEVEAEIKKLKEKKICDSCKISFFDFLTADDRQLKIFLSSYKIVRLFKEEDWSEEFPHFRSILYHQLVKGDNRMLLLARGCEIFSLLIKPFPLLKWNLKEQMRILNLMDNYELNCFKRAWYQFSSPKLNH